MPAAIKTDRSGRSRTNCSQAQATPWTLSCACSAVFRGFFAHLPKLRLGGVPYGLAHFLKVFRHFFRLFAKLISCVRHGSSSLVKW